MSCRSHRFLVAVLLLVGALLGSGRAWAVETTVVHWTFSLPFWEYPNREGAFGGYTSGSFDIVVTDASITVHNLHTLGFVFDTPSGGSSDDVYSPWWETWASPTYVRVSFRGPADWCFPEVGCDWKYQGAMGVTVDGDLTKARTTLPVIGGGFNYSIGHYTWDYGSFAAGPDSFVVGEVPEPETWLMTLAGLAFLCATARRRSKRLAREGGSPAIADFERGS